ncbi:MAG: UDP-N-acetylmuramoyl-L-alanyl-D-glutamate--2,6-diaminopimelate ligase [Anaerolineae bacterium]
MMRLEELMAKLPEAAIAGPVKVEVTGITHDSRQVQPGDLFVAIKGLNVDGHHCIAEAIEKGAVAIVVERELKEFSQFPLVPFFVVPDSREALAHLAAVWHGFPARKLKVIGVTGTDGKTTTVELIRAILEAAGHRTGLIDTVKAVIGQEVYDTGFHTTTPDAPDVQRFLAQMVEADTEYVVLEATSHGLSQHRVTAVDFDLGVITNITHEHLDYHGTFEEYREAKARLFRSLSTSFRKPGVPKVAVLNADDPSLPYLQTIPADQRWTYGLNNPADVSARGLLPTSSGTRFQVVTPRGSFLVETPLLGQFNLYNILAAVTVGLSQGISEGAMQEGIRRVKGVVGRMERVEMGQDFTVIVDFAHTPNALEQVLETVRSLTAGRVIVVFGCAGLRDRTKRPMMGEIAGRLADRVVITAEDPRTESLDEIMGQIVVGCEKVGRVEGEDYWRIGDREEAIAYAIRMAQPGDLVIVTGKGHERTMCFGTTEYPWSDHEAVVKGLRRRGY